MKQSSLVHSADQNHHSSALSYAKPQFGIVFKSCLSVIVHESCYKPQGKLVKFSITWGLTKNQLIEQIETNNLWFNVPELYQLSYILSI